MHSHFDQLYPSLKGYEITSHFKRDVGTLEGAEKIAQNILDSNHEAFEELHKFEEVIHGNHVFRAKINKEHYVYLITKEHRLIFVRAFKNFSKYKKYLEEKKILGSF